MTLGVSKQHRRKGLARTILELSEHEMYSTFNCEKLTLHCKVDNTDALSFYGNMRFYVDKRIDSYYEINGRSEDAYHLVRDIQTPQHHFLENENARHRPILASIFQLDNSKFHKEEIPASIANYTYPKWIPKENRYGCFSPLIKTFNQSLESIDESFTWVYFFVIQIHLILWEFLRRILLLLKNYWNILSPAAIQSNIDSKNASSPSSAIPQEHGIPISLLAAETKEYQQTARRNVSSRDEAHR